MKRIISFILSIVVLLSLGLTASANENFITANGFTLDVSNGYITDFMVSNYNGGNDVVIPNSIGGVKVIGIADFAFQSAFDDLAGEDWVLTDEEAAQRKIYIHSNITNLTDNAFYTGYVGTPMTIVCEENSYAYKYLVTDKGGMWWGTDVIIGSVQKVDLQADSTAVSSGTVGSSAGQQITETPTSDIQGDLTSTDTTIAPEVKPHTVTTSFGATVSEWAAPEIEEAFENNLIPEVMLDFDLTKKVNRGEFAAIAVQLYEVLAKRNVEESPSCTFTDIQYDDNEKAIKKAYQIEVAQGTSTTTYEPLSFINREQLATMLCRVIKKYSYPNWTMENDADYYMDTTGVQKFADDVDISEWAKPSVYFMAKFGIVKGVSDTHFAPKNTTTQQEASGYASATREQAIILAQRIFKISDVFGN